MSIKSLETMGDISNKKVFVRVDWNVENEHLDDISETRIQNSLQSIEYLNNTGAQLIIISHKGRPNGKWKKDESLKSVVDALNNQTNLTFELLDFDLQSEIPKLRKALEQKISKGIIVLENIRFYEEELNNDNEFAKELSEVADYLVIDAFSVCHRNQMSVAALSLLMPSYAGFTVLNEINNLQTVLSPPNNSIIMFGGAKLKTKLHAVNELAPKYRKILLGSIFGKLFQDVSGDLNKEFGKLSVQIEPELVEFAKDIYTKYKEKIVLPVDYIVSQNLEESAQNFSKKYDMINADEYILDVGPETINQYAKILKHAEMIVWNGPLGFYEKRPYQHSTRALGHVIATRSDQVHTVIGGGDTISVVYDLDIIEDINFISTGGGAMLEYLYNQHLPGLTNLFE